MWWLALWACGGGPQVGTQAEADELLFLRGAVVSSRPELPESRPWPAGGSLVALDWQPGEAVTIAGTEAEAPARPECLPMFSVELGDVSRLVAMGGAPPDTDVRFSPDGSKLAIGSYRGEVVVVDAWTGEVQARRRLAESMIKFVRWSPDGTVLYAAEQSPDANVYAMDPQTLQERWTVRLAEHVESSPAPAGEDLYGVYTLPAAYGMEVLSTGDLLLSGSHGWNDSAGERQNRGVLLRVGADGAVQARFPETGAIRANLMHPRIDEDGGHLVISVSHSAAEAPPEDLPIGGVMVLDLQTLSRVADHAVPPLRPYYDRASVWEALDIDGELILMGLNDGRTQVVHWPTGEVKVALETGAPVLAGEVPIASSIGFATFAEPGLVYLTSRTRIPWGAASPELHPPTAHPKENGLYAHTLDGALSWTWSGPAKVDGMSIGRDGRSLVVGAGSRDSDHRSDLFGALLFDLAGEGSGKDRLRATCSTAGPVFFRQELLGLDERVAVTEYPWVDEAGDVRGQYRVTVLR